MWAGMGYQSMVELYLQTRKKPHILVADSEPGIPTLVSFALSPHFEMVGAVYDGDAAILATVGIKPDVLILDLILPGLSSLEVIRRVTGGDPRLKVIVLTALDDRVSATKALEAGASGFVVKRRMKIDLPVAIRQVLSGKTFVSAGSGNTL
jgi:DNA-binding NarL/FixJ family response regulator